MLRTQRLVLILGALSALVVVYNTPKVFVVGGTLYQNLRSDSTIAAVVDVRTVGMYLVGVVAATALSWLALTPRPLRDGQDDTLALRIDVLERECERLWAECSRDIRALESHLTEPK